jgi:DNA-binding transcriptional ArsR family regulator
MLVRYMPKYTAPLDSTFQALADPTRRAVLARLADGPLTVSVLAAPFGMALPSFMQHLRMLEDGGLIASEKIGRSRTCRIVPESAAAAEGWIAAQRARWTARTDRLQSFLETGADLDDGPIPKETT